MPKVFQDLPSMEKKDPRQLKGILFRRPESMSFQNGCHEPPPHDFGPQDLSQCPSLQSESSVESFFRVTDSGSIDQPIFREKILNLLFVLAHVHKNGKNPFPLQKLLLCRDIRKRFTAESAAEVTEKNQEDRLLDGQR